MRRTAYTIKMLHLLSSGGKYKKKEIADYLGVNPRNINEYRKELEESGYQIDSIPGKDGGYQLVRSRVAKLPMTTLSDEEWMALISASSYLETDQNFTKKDDFIRAINKIKVEKGLPEGVPIFHATPIKLQIDSEKLKEFISEIEYAINHKEYVKCEYISRSSKKAQQIKRGEYRPYALYIYQNMWYAIFERNNHSGVFFHVKLNRFKHVRATGKSFKYEYFEAFKLENYIKESGQVIDPLTFQLRIDKKLNPYFDEYMYGTQEIIEENDEFVWMKIHVQNNGQAKSIIRYLGRTCKVLEPASLVNEIKEELLNEYRQYKEEHDEL